MSEQTPFDIAVAAYDANLNEQLGNPPGFVLGFDLRNSPAIVAMLAAHEQAVLQRVLGSEDDPTGVLDRFTVACAPNEPGKPLFFWHCDRCNVVHVIARDLEGDQSGVTLAEMAESAMAHEEECHSEEVAQ